MYHSSMISIGKVENGFIVECMVPLKKKKKKKDKEEGLYCSPSQEKQFIAKTPEEVSAYISKMLPLLESDGLGEDEFSEAFNEGANSED